MWESCTSRSPERDCGPLGDADVPSNQGFTSPYSRTCRCEFVSWFGYLFARSRVRRSPRWDLRKTYKELSGPSSFGGSSTAVGVIV